MSGLGPFSEADLVAAAAVLAASDAEDWVPGGDRRLFVVRAAVVTARMLAAEVRLTGPVPHVPLHGVLEFVRGLRDSVFDAKGLREAADPASYVAARIDEHFGDDGLRPEYDLASLRERPRFRPREQVEKMLAGAHRPLTEHQESGAVMFDEVAPPLTQAQVDYVTTRGPAVSCERQARDLLLRLGVAGDWTAGDLGELANLFNEVRRLQVARIGDSERINLLMTDNDRNVRVLLDALAARAGDQQRLFHLEGLLQHSITHDEQRGKTKAIRDALLGPGVHDPGHPPTAELARVTREGYEQALADRDLADAAAAEVREQASVHAQDLRDEVTRLGELLQNRSIELAAMQDRRKGDYEAIRLLMGEVAALQQAATDREVRCLRRAAEEIENGLLSGAVPPRELLQNCVAWYRVQAGSLEGTPVDPVQQVSVTLHGGGPGGGKALRLTMDKSCPACGSTHVGVIKQVRKANGRDYETCYDLWHGEGNATIRTLRDARPRCPTCDSPDRDRHPAVQHGGEVQVCRDPWHGGKVCPRCAGTWTFDDPQPVGQAAPHCGDLWHSLKLRSMRDLQARTDGGEM